LSYFFQKQKHKHNTTGSRERIIGLKQYKFYSGGNF